MSASQTSARSLRATSRAWLRQTTVPNAGAGRRPASILRSVSGEMPAPRATSTRLRPARAARRAAPRRWPAAICSAVSGWRTMPAGYPSGASSTCRGIKIPHPERGAVVIELKSAEEIGRMAVTGQFVGELLAELSGVAAVGINLMDLEHHARRRIKERGAESCYWDYAPSFGRGPFRNVLCLSVNDAVLHGLPHDYVLRDGDLLSIDMAAGIDGWVADSALSVIVGTPDPADLKLIEATEVALEAGITAAQPGGRLGDISAAIGEVAHRYGYGLNDEFGGHGIGRTMHEAPHVPNNGPARRGMKLEPGLTIAFEPWSCRATDKIRFDNDGWTIRSADGSRTAHCEHTVAITASGPQVLTRRPAHGAPPADPAKKPATAS